MPATCRTCTSRPAASWSSRVANPAISLVKGQPNSVFDADGSAIVIHAKADDYKS